MYPPTELLHTISICNRTCGISQPLPSAAVHTTSYKANLQQHDQNRGAGKRTALHWSRKSIIAWTSWSREHSQLRLNGLSEARNSNFCKRTACASPQMILSGGSPVMQRRYEPMWQRCTVLVPEIYQTAQKEQTYGHSCTLHSLIWFIAAHGLYSKIV